jgi:hypothetical protein
LSQAAVKSLNNTDFFGEAFFVIPAHPESFSAFRRIPDAPPAAIAGMTTL